MPNAPVMIRISPIQPIGGMESRINIADQNKADDDANGAVDHADVVLENGTHAAVALLGWFISMHRLSLLPFDRQQGYQSPRSSWISRVSICSTAHGLWRHFEVDPD